MRLIHVSSWLVSAQNEAGTPHRCDLNQRYIYEPLYIYLHTRMGERELFVRRKVIIVAS
jgi:hypothetical protein